MSTQDRITGRLKKAAGDLIGDEHLHSEGVTEERKADAKRELRDAQQLADQKREEVARLESEHTTDSYRHGDRDAGAAGDDLAARRRGEVNSQRPD